MLKIHNSGVVSSTSTNNQGGKHIEIQSSPTQQTITNAQVCLDTMALNEVDVRTFLFVCCFQTEYYGNINIYIFFYLDVVCSRAIIIISCFFHLFSVLY